MDSPPPWRANCTRLWLGAGAPKIGLGLWNHRLATIATELAVLAAGGWIYLRQSRPGTHGVRLGTVAFGCVLIAAAVATPFQPDPPSAQAFAVLALALYVVLSVVAGLVDRGRQRNEVSP